ncbi:malto-oligosyltrehalose synthase [Variovorax ginsengisoli]|uniref:4-alpha-glucanotransferase n=1 Tax=Variovorax ginsengisoli TaxID=363844 RepID=A0ABT9SEN6_9BURK|nr:malto-oligosyltrehalose synthase [Variovorax ginsengisoli]MDP9902238.1 (1->4)-alpha-D-glucan 1-alpha-D-glucosylmutase [Variovorax ginsengisoli]
MDDAFLSQHDALMRLCAHFGIAPDYHDIFGHRHVIADEHLVALLAGFGIDSATPLQDSLRQVEHDGWRRALPPALAIHAGESHWSLTLRVPAALAEAHWTLLEEDGTRRNGQLSLHALPERSRTDIDGVAYCERRIALQMALPVGYHRLSVEGLTGETLLISAPAHCYRPPALADDGRVWGPAVQLYALRSKRNWGIGDFTDLGQLAQQAAKRGAGIVGLNPLHAMFPHNPAHTSPYSPSSRLALDVLYIDVEAIDEFRDCDAAQRLVQSPDFQSRLAALRDVPLVDYPGVAAAKFEVLELLYAHFLNEHLNRAEGQPLSPAADAFEVFRASRGNALRQHALFEALQAHFHAADASVWGWPVWPADYRDPTSPEVARFVDSHAERIGYYEYLQWQATRQLARASAQCDAAGMAVGLYLDLAVSVDRAGSDAWTEQQAFVDGASVGAPPDEFNPNGQGWGLPPLRPDRLRTSGYRFFIETLRANMQGGALRIDHVMGLMRLFWIPPGGTPHQGAYVHYALDEMLAIVAIESQRQQCMVIGEDLGTVADEMRGALSRFEVLSYRLVYFERNADGEFKSPDSYPRNALVAISTHDLATLNGWWTGHDLRQRLALGLFPNQSIFEKQLFDRAQERVRLLLAVQRAGLLSADAVAQATGAQTLPAAVVAAIHAFAASTPSQVMMVQLEDAIGMVDQANMPGTVDTHPNWCRKLTLDLQELAVDSATLQLCETLAAIRPHPAPQASARRGVDTLIPRATYRLQFHKDFNFDDAVKILPYLARLGVSHVYCSPIQRARPGSMHGYDVVAHDEINPELGGREGFERFSAALRTHGMGQLLDLVPNHMGVLGGDNAWWNDVLENGEASLYAQHFDIDWQPLNVELHGKVLLPVLGDHYGDVLERGELKLAFDPEHGSLSLDYHDHRFPLAPESYPRVLQRAESRLNDAEMLDGLASIASAFGHLPTRETPQPEAVAERARDKEVLKGRLARLVSRQVPVAQAIAAAVADFNQPGERDALHDLLERQAYRLAYWRVAADEINYRRFFDINELAALRIEREPVFEATHRMALDLAAAGVVDGLRIDHPDGLYDPAQYFERLQEGFARRAGLVLPSADADGRPARPLYVVAEKIAASHEEVPVSWHIHGTTGYRFATVVNGVLLDHRTAERFSRIWRSFTGVHESFEELGYQGKRAIMRNALASELTVLSTELLRIARANRHTRDYTLNTLRRALAEVAACMAVYRSYIIEAPSDQDRHYIDQAVDLARERSLDADGTVFDFVRLALRGQAMPGSTEALRARVLRLAIRFQQFSAPVTAKGVEDTAFYRYFPLSSLNEVGGEPAHFGMTVADFHAASTDRARRWPHTMLATSTHDNKRSEDVRNRINVLSEMPATWRLALRRWRAMNGPAQHDAAPADAAQAAAAQAPSPADQYLLYQTLLGTLPAGGLDAAGRQDYVERIQRYMLKAARESKAHTSWVNPNNAYEDALTGFIARILGRVDDNAFLDDLKAFGATLAWFGALNSLSMILIKYGSAGVPDLYQGNELMDLSLVDPDNRRPVDYAARGGWLDRLETIAHQDDMARDVGALAAAPHDGGAKLWATWRLLALRRDQPALFRDGSYTALDVTGTQAAHAVAFTRTHEAQTLVVIAGRLFVGLATEAEAQAFDAADTHWLPLGESVWGDTRVALPGWADGARFQNLLTGEVLTVAGGALRMAQAFAHFPGAALTALDARP